MDKQGELYLVSVVVSSIGYIYHVQFGEPDVFEFIELIEFPLYVLKHGLEYVGEFE
jgi:hypothetical protein